MRKIAATYIFPVSSPPLKYGILILDDQEKILEVKDTGGKLHEEAGLEYYNGILVPGFVNAQGHSRHSILSEMKAIQEKNEKVTLQELIQQVTLNGAKALRKEDQLGSFEVGKIPGVYLLEKADLHNLRLMPDTKVRRLV